MPIMLRTGKPRPSDHADDKGYQYALFVRPHGGWFVVIHDCTLRLTEFFRRSKPLAMHRFTGVVMFFVSFEIDALSRAATKRSSITDAPHARRRS
jgi:hypothetical protein